MPYFLSTLSAGRLVRQAHHYILQHFYKLSYFCLILRAILYRCLLMPVSLRKTILLFQILWRKVLSLSKCWETWIRTKIASSRGTSPTISLAHRPEPGLRPRDDLPILFNFYINVSHH